MAKRQLDGMRINHDALSRKAIELADAFERMGKLYATASTEVLRLTATIDELKTDGTFSDAFAKMWPK